MDRTSDPPVHRSAAPSFEFDGEADALYLKLRKGNVASSEPFGEDVVLDLDDKEGHRLGTDLRRSIRR